MRSPFPDPDTPHPVILPDGQAHAGTVFLSAVIDHPNIEVGEYSYASALRPPEDWAARLAPFLYPGAQDRLILGRFCQIADGAVFITHGANHRRDGFSTFPFAIFDGGIGSDRPSLPSGAGRDTVLGHDVWVGKDARILPGSQIGDGVIIGAGAVVSGVIPAYSVVAGNPATVIRGRFDDATIARLEAIAWWDWPIETILAHEAAICGADLAALEAAAARSASPPAVG